MTVVKRKEASERFKTPQLCWHTVEQEEAMAWEEEERRRERALCGHIMSREREREDDLEREMSVLILRPLIGQFKKERGGRKKKQKNGNGQDRATCRNLIGPFRFQNPKIIK